MRLTFVLFILVVLAQTATPAPAAQDAPNLVRVELPIEVPIPRLYDPLHNDPFLGPLRAIDPAIGDVGPMALSQRTLQPDLRRPTAFEHVYRVPGRDDLLMRVDGGLFALFPRSEYVAGIDAAIPVVPTGTTFYIGSPGAAGLGPAPHAVELDTKDQRLATELDLRRVLAVPEAWADIQPLDLRVGDDPEARTDEILPAPRHPARPGWESRAGRMAPRTTLPRIVSDRDYRMQRIKELMGRSLASRAPAR